MATRFGRDTAAGFGLMLGTPILASAANMSQLASLELCMPTLDVTMKEVGVTVPQDLSKEVWAGVNKSIEANMQKAKTQMLGILGAMGLRNAFAILAGGGKNNYAMVGRQMCVGGAPEGGFLSGATLVNSDSKTPITYEASATTMALRTRRRRGYGNLVGWESGRLRKNLTMQVAKDGSRLMLGATDAAVKQRAGLPPRDKFTYAKLLLRLERGGSIPITNKTRTYALRRAMKLAKLHYPNATNIYETLINARDGTMAKSWFLLSMTKQDTLVIPPRPIMGPALEMAVRQMQADPRMGKPIYAALMARFIKAGNSRRPGTGASIQGPNLSRLQDAGGANLVPRALKRYDTAARTILRSGW